MKPVCKSECDWEFWRGEGPRKRGEKHHFSKWAKRRMARARRRWGSGRREIRDYKSE